MKRFKFKPVAKTVCAAVSLLSGTGAAAMPPLALPNVFSDDMVLQRQVPIPVYGISVLDSIVTVRLMDGEDAVVASISGPVSNRAWKVRLPALEAGGPYQMKIVGDVSGAVVFSNVMVGEVYILAGQSNMDLSIANMDNKVEILANCTNFPIRIVTPTQTPSETPLDEYILPDREGVNKTWKQMDASSGLRFSALAYFFGTNLCTELGVTVGFINTSRGGTRIHEWLPVEVLESNETLSYYLTDTNVPPCSEWYNALVAPAIGYGARGIFWYQGEGNVGKQEEYKEALSVLMTSWRERWDIGTIPFLVFQLPGYGAPVAPPQIQSWGMFRLAQEWAVTNNQEAYLVVNVPGGERGDIHPQDKPGVAWRAARLALKNLHGVDLIDRGPRFLSASLDGGSAVCTFDTGGAPLIAKGLTVDGLAISGDSLSGFALAGSDGIWASAEAFISNGSNVVVRAAAVQEPVSVMYGLEGFPLCNLFNAADLPCAPFLSKISRVQGPALYSSSVWNERFDGISLNTNLSIKTSAQGSVTQMGGQLQMLLSGNGASQRARVSTPCSQTGETGAGGNGLYDFTGHQVSVRFDIASFAGSPSTANNYNIFETGLGELSATGAVTNGVKVNLAKRNNGISDYFRFELTGFGAAINPELNGLPAAFEYDLDGTGLSIRVEGTTFKTTGSESYSWIFNPGKASSYQLMFGALNNGTPLTGTQIALDSFKVAVFDVPAPLVPLAYEIGVAAASGANQIANDMFTDDRQWTTGISNCNWYLYRGVVTDPAAAGNANYIHPGDLVDWVRRNNKGISMVFNNPTSTLNDQGTRPRDLGIDVVDQMQRIYAAGGRIDRLFLDGAGFGPLLLDRFDGSLTVEGTPGGLPLDAAIGRMVDLWKSVHRTYPGVRIGLYFNVGQWDWNHEADPGLWYPGDASKWTYRSGYSFEQCVTALHAALAAVGEKIGFIDLDMGYSRYLKTEVSPAHHAYPHALDYKAYARAVQAWCSSREIDLFITLFPGSLTGSNQQYYESLMSWVQALKNDEIYPDAFHLNNWTAWPDVNLPESTAYTFANAVRDVSGAIRSLNNTVYPQFVNPPPVIPGQATNPSPASGSDGVSLDASLEWDWGANVIAMQVTLGTNNPPGPADQQIGLTHFDPVTGRMIYDPGVLEPAKTYYWRVDSLNNHPEHDVTAGPIWSFTTQAATSRVFIPTEDAKVSSINASVVYGSAQSFQALTGAAVVESYLKFSLSGISNVQFAKLRLYPADSLAGQMVPLIRGLSVYPCADIGWSEGSVTWNTKPVPDLAALTPLDSSFPVSGSGFYELDVTTAVTGVVNGAGTVSFALGTAEHLSLLLASSENTNVELRPLLIIVGGEHATAWAAWQSTHFTSEEIAGGLADASQDPDGDGLDNLLEYALGGNPADADAAVVRPVLQGVENHFYHIHNERTDDANLTYTVELSTNLVSNIWKTNGVEFVGDAAFSNVWKTVTNRTNVGDGAFIRLKVEKN